MSSVVGYAEEPYMYTDELESKQPKFCGKCGCSLEGDSDSKNPQYDIYTGRLLDTAILKCPIYDEHDRWKKDGKFWERV